MMKEIYYLKELEKIKSILEGVIMANQSDKNAAQKQIVYRAKCLECKYEWTSRAGSGTPNCCPKCRSNRITISPLS